MLSVLLKRLLRGSRTERTKRRILDAAEAIVVARGFGALSLGGVAKIAKIGKSALLHHYGSRNLLVRALIAQAVRKDLHLLASQLQRAKESSPDSVRQVLRVLLEFEKAFHRGRARPLHVLSAVAAEMGAFDDKTREFVRDQTESLAGFLAALLDLALSASASPETADADALAADCLAAILGGSSLAQLGGDQDAPGIQVARFRAAFERLLIANPGAAPAAPGPSTVQGE
jgi:AcrR family transcriptional regulator